MEIVKFVNRIIEEEFYYSGMTTPELEFFSRRCYISFFDCLETLSVSSSGNGCFNVIGMYLQLLSNERFSDEEEYMEIPKNIIDALLQTKKQTVFELQQKNLPKIELYDEDETDNETCLNIEQITKISDKKFLKMSENFVSYDEYANEDSE